MLYGVLPVFSNTAKLPSIFDKVQSYKVGPLEVGANTIAIAVRAPNNASEVYTLQLQRKGATQLHSTAVDHPVDPTLERMRVESCLIHMCIRYQYCVVLSAEWSMEAWNQRDDGSVWVAPADPVLAEILMNRQKFLWYLRGANRGYAALNSVV